MVENPEIIAVLDACVLYPAPVRDILLNIAQTRLYSAKWSDKINTEWTRNLLKNRPDLKEANLIRTLGEMNNSFTEANVTGFEHLIPTIELPDLDDRHVVACAIQCEAEIIVTKNLKDFPKEALEKFSIVAQHPDDFICNLFKIDEKTLQKALNKQLKTLKNPPQTKEQLLATFRKNDLIKAAELFAQNTE